MNPRITGQGTKARVASDFQSDFPRPHGHPSSQEKDSLWARLPVDKISPWAEVRLATLRQEQVPELYWSDLNILGHEAEKNGELFLASAIYQEIIDHAPLTSQRDAAQAGLAGLSGQGASTGSRLEHLSHHWLEQTTDPAMLLGMVGAGLAYQGGRALAWRQLQRWGVGESLGVWGQKSLAALGGFITEVPAFVLVGKGTHQIFGDKVSWELQELQQELIGSAMVLGALKLSGFGGHGVLKKLHGFDGALLAGTPPRLSGLYPVTQKLIPPGAMLAGIMAGNRAQAAYYHQEPPEFYMGLLDGMATLLQFQAAGKLTPHLAPRLNRLTQELNTQSTQQQNIPFTRPFSGGENFAWAAAPLGPPRTFEKLFSPDIFMESRGDFEGDSSRLRSRPGRQDGEWAKHLDALATKQPRRRVRAMELLAAQMEALPRSAKWELAVTILDHAVNDVGGVRRAAKKTLPRITQALTHEKLLEPWLELVDQTLRQHPKSGLDRVLQRWLPAEDKLRSQFAALSDLYDKVWFLSDLAVRGRSESGPRFQKLYLKLLESLEDGEQKFMRDEVEVSFQFPDEVTLNRYLDSLDTEGLLEFETQFRAKYLVDLHGNRLSLDAVPPRVITILGEIDSRWQNKKISTWSPWFREVFARPANEQVAQGGKPESSLHLDPESTDTPNNLISFVGYGKPIEYQRALEKFYSLKTITEKGEWLYELFLEHEGSPLFMDLFEELHRRLSWKQQIQITQIGLLRFWQEASPDFHFLFQHKNLREFQSQYDIAHQLFLTDTEGNQLSREESLPEVRKFLERMDHHLTKLKNQAVPPETPIDSAMVEPVPVSAQVIELFRHHLAAGRHRETLPETISSVSGADILQARHHKYHGLDQWRHLPLDHSAAHARIESIINQMDSDKLMRLQELSLEAADQPWLVTGVSDGIGMHLTLGLMASGLMSRGIGVFYENPQLLEWNEPVRMQRLAQAQALAEAAQDFGVEFYLHFTDMALADTKNGDRSLPGDILQSLRLLQSTSALPELNFFDAMVAGRGLSAIKGVKEPLKLPSIDYHGRVIMTELPKYTARHYRGTFDGMGRNHGLLLHGLSEYFGPHSKSFFPTWAAGSQNYRGLKGVYAGSVLGKAKIRAETDTLQYHLESAQWNFNRGRHKSVRYPSFLSHSLSSIPGAGAFGRLSKAVLSEHGLYQDVSELALRTLLEAYDGTHHWDHPMASLELDAAETAFLPQIEGRLEIFWQRVGDYMRKHPEWEGQALDAETSTELLQGLLSEAELGALP